MSDSPRLRRVPIGTAAGGHLALQVAEAGAGGRPLLLVHGFTGAKEDFTQFLQPLAARGWHAVAPDLRGHGDSDHPAGQESYSFDILAADMVRLADALGWGSFAVVGHSMGGALAQRMALAHPTRLDALVLIATFHGPVNGVDPELVEMGTAIVEQGGMPALAKALEVHRPGYSEVSQAKVIATSSELWLALAPRFLDDADRLKQLCYLDVPTAVIVGELDAAMLDDCRRMAAAIPGAELTVLPGAGHSPQSEDPVAWWAALTSFLDSLPVPAGSSNVGSLNVGAR